MSRTFSSLRRIVLAFLLLSYSTSTVLVAFSTELDGKWSTSASSESSGFVFTQSNYTEIAVNPETHSANPGEYFTFNVTVFNVTKCYGWQFKLKWPIGLLEADAANITEGPFLSDWSPPSTILVTKVFASYVDIACTFLGLHPGVNGSGTLATVTLKVTGVGNATLKLYDTKLLESPTLAPIPHDTKDAFFYTTKPVARYTYAPHPSDFQGRPIVGETVTFNGSESYDPDQSYENQTGNGISSYQWDFGDNSTDTGMIVDHTYSDPGSYTVKLNVTDDDVPSLSTTVSKPVIGVNIVVNRHDIAIINVTALTDEVSLDAPFTFNVTVDNQGSELATETLNVTLYANMNPVVTKLFNYSAGPLNPNEIVLTPGENQTTTVKWDTTGVPAGSYLISVRAFLVTLGSGGWAARSDLERTEDLFDNGMLYGTVNITGEEKHDLAVTGLKLSSTKLELDDWARLDVTVENEGTKTEQFNITLTIEYALNTTTTIPSVWKNLTISPGETRTFDLFHSAFKGSNTTNVGDYNITVQVLLLDSNGVDFLPGYNASTPDDDPADNILSAQLSIQVYPVASFTYSPEDPVIDETVTFNASASYALGIPAGTIQQYVWSFGDGATATEAAPTTTHVYRAPGDFTVTLRVIHENTLANNVSKTLTVSSAGNIDIINVAFSPHMATSGDSITVDVTIEARFEEESFNLTAYYDGQVIDTLYNVTLPVGNATTLSLTWDTAGVPGGDYTIKAVAATQTENTTFTGGVAAIERLPSTITLAASSHSVAPGTEITLNGTVSILAAVDVTISVKLDDAETWSTLANVTANADGTYSTTWTPENVGSYALKASWQGNTLTKPSASDAVAVSVQEAGASSLYLYSTIGLAVVVVILLAYMFMYRKPGSK